MFLPKTLLIFSKFFEINVLEKAIYALVNSSYEQYHTQSHTPRREDRKKTRGKDRGLVSSINLGIHV